MASGWFLVPYQSPLQIFGDLTGNTGVPQVKVEFASGPTFDKFTKAGYQEFSSAQSAQQAANNFNTTSKQQASKVGPKNPLSNVNDFLTRLANGNTWLRIGEGILGLILIAAGMYSLTKNTSTATAVRAVGKKIL